MSGGRLTTDQATVVLASYLERPHHLMVPPLRERERVANILGRSVADVTACMWAFAGLDQENPSTGEGDATTGKLWEQYHDDRVEAMIAADAIVEARRSVPHHLRS